MTSVRDTELNSALATPTARLFGWVMRHWLVLVLIPLLFFVTMPFLAPVLMEYGGKEAGKLLYTLYLPFCHQLPQRSWFFFGEKLTYTLDEIKQVYPFTDPLQIRFFYGTSEMGWRVAWSDRMISFYTLTPIFGFLYAGLRRHRPIRPIALSTLVVFEIPIVLDGITHLISDALSGVSGGGFRDVNGWLMQLTGNAWPAFYAGDHLGTFNWWMRLITGVVAAWGLAFWVFPLIDREIQREIGSTGPNELR